MPEQRLTLAEGWYRFGVADKDAVVVVTLADPALPAFVQLTATSATPAHARLAAGTYRAETVSNLPSPAWSLVRLDAAARLRFFSTEVFRRLKAGQSPEAFLRQIGRVFHRSTGTGGVAGAGAGTSPAGLPASGPLAVARLADITRGVRYAECEGPAIFVTACDEASLLSQSYRSFTTDPARRDDCELLFTLPAGAVLAPDALRKLARPFIDSPGVDLVFADVFHDSTSTYNFAHDPRLHGASGDLSPIVLRRRAATTPRRIVRLGEPLAIVKALTAAYSPPPPPPPTDTPVSCIIPTRDRAGLLEQVTTGLLDGSDGVGDIVVVDNGSVQTETFALFERLARHGVKIIRDDGDFNFSRLCNVGSRQAESPLLAFINNDIKVRRRDWLSNLARWAVLPDVGAVGTRLLYEDNSLQHGGIALGLGGVCGHPFRHWPEAAWSQVPSLVHPGTRSAVTGAVLMVEAAKFNAAGGFDAEHFPVTLNDVDLCLRLQKAGYDCVYDPAGEAWHLEGRSRGEDDAPLKRARRDAEIRTFLSRWAAEIEAERWFSPLLSRAHEEIRLL
ncbi:glycosyltransferase family 2 protein [Asticcacaulis solisilvae]|uniref:glycosyltransferase family 2 protein n=1 Tax=Asticcacaulis solisilvae TaxID=1217274 RepID=UPI003FD6DD17